MQAKQAEKVWNRVFPPKIGSRVKIVRFKNSNGTWNTSPKVIGRIGTVTEIDDNNWFPYKVQFDGERNENSYPFMLEELERIETTEE